jgi:hypothetical protein
MIRITDSDLGSLADSAPALQDGVEALTPTGGPSTAHAYLQAAFADYRTSPTSRAHAELEVIQAPIGVLSFHQISL